MGYLRLFLLLMLPCTLYGQDALPSDTKTVLLAILARNKEHVLDRYLESISNLDYDKKLITVYINTNNNDDSTEKMLECWVVANKALYRDVIFDRHTVADLPSSRPHEWNGKRFKVLGAIRNTSMQKAVETESDYYFVVDCDNFLIPSTLRELVNKQKPIIAPLLQSIPEEGDMYSNYFCAIDERGYYKDHPDYSKLLHRQKLGEFKVPVVHCTYLIERAYIDKLTYMDATDDYEFVIFSRSARANGVDQYICNEQPFGTVVHFFVDVTQAQEKKRLDEYFLQK